MLLNETMRKLAGHCVTVCSEYEAKQKSPVTAEQEEPRALPKFTMQEEVCLAKCEAKMMVIHSAVERHIDDSFNPSLVKTFI